ncbi:MAG: PAS domain S-box protein, partial [Gammaproteobacteria bacterium]
MFSKRRDDYQLWGSVFPFMQHLAKRNLLVETLQLSDAKYRSLFESMDQGIIYLDAMGVVISINQAALFIIGLDKENILGQRVVDVCAKIIRQDGSDFPSEQHPALVALQSLKPVEPVVMGLFNTEKNDYVWVTVTAVPEFLPGQLEPYQVLMALKDITRLKQAEEKLNLASL